MDKAVLDKELDRTKARIFIGTSAAFLGPLMCSMKWEWDEQIKTAATDGATVWWNPTFFMELTKEHRITVLLHELWHTARLHMQRKGSRDSRLWNIACDYVINNDLVKAGHVFDGIGLVDPTYEGMAEEDIYSLLDQQKSLDEAFEYEDLREPSKEALREGIQNVVRAVQAAQQVGGAGSIPGNVLSTIDSYLTPVVPWERLLDRFMEDLLDEDYSWSRPNRRYPDIYLPHRFKDEGKLQKLNYYLDVSGSISNNDILRFNSEIRFIKEKYNPTELNLIQFDTDIRKVTVIKDSDRLTTLDIIGRGGTSLIPVREHIIDNKPTAAIIFSDLDCSPMRELPVDIPIIWVILNNPYAKPSFGTSIHIKATQ